MWIRNKHSVMRCAMFQRSYVKLEHGNFVGKRWFLCGYDVLHGFALHKNITELIGSPIALAFDNCFYGFGEEEGVIEKRERGIGVRVPDNYVCFSALMEHAVDHPAAHRIPVRQEVGEIGSVDLFPVSTDKSGMLANRQLAKGHKLFTLSLKVAFYCDTCG